MSYKVHRTQISFHNWMCQGSRLHGARGDVTVVVTAKISGIAKKGKVCIRIWGQNESASSLDPSDHINAP